jgi:uncharacterized protein YcfJ
MVIENSNSVYQKITDMKQTLIIVSTTLLFAACKQKAAETNSNYPSDTATYNNSPANSSNAQGTVRYSSPTSGSNHRAYVSTPSNSSPTTVVRKKEWSSAAKGTAIGAASGAVLGAVLSKDHHRAKGAVIGGAAGAAGGYLYGRHRDKKNGRY